jgi:hypothetical protein
MLDASSSILTSAVAASKGTTPGPEATAPAEAVNNNAHVQAWMVAMKAAAPTANAILDLPVGGVSAAK